MFVENTYSMSTMKTMALGYRKSSLKSIFSSFQSLVIPDRNLACDQMHKIKYKNTVQHKKHI